MCKAISENANGCSEFCHRMRWVRHAKIRIIEGTEQAREIDKGISRLVNTQKRRENATIVTTHIHDRACMTCRNNRMNFSRSCDLSEQDRWRQAILKKNRRALDLAIQSSFPLILDSVRHRNDRTMLASMNRRGRKS